MARRFNLDSIMAPMGRPRSIMGVRPMLREPVLDMAGEKSIFGQPSPFGPPLQANPVPSIGGMGGSNFGGQPLQAPIEMPRNPEMVELINQQMLPQPIPQVRSPLQNAFDNLQKQIGPQPFLQQPQAPQTGGIPVTGGGPLGSGILPEANLPAGTPPVTGPALGSFKIPTGPAMGGISAIPTDTAPPQNTQFDTNLRNQLLGGTPPKRNDFMSIAQDPNQRPRDGEVDNRQGMPFQPVQAVNPQPAPFVPPQQPAFTPLSERTDIYGEGKKYDPANLPEGFSYDSPRDGNNAYSMVMPSMGNVYAYGPDGQRREVPSGIQSPGFKDTIPGGGYLSDLFNPGIPTDTGMLDPRTRTTEARLPGPPLQATPAPGIGGMGGQNNGLIRDPNGNMVDPNNLPDNMVLQQDPNFGPSVRFADDYVLQPSDQGYQSNGMPRSPVQYLANPAPGTGGMGGRPGEPEPINLGQPPVPPSTTGQLPVPPGLTAGTPPVQTEPVDTPVEPVNVTTPTDPNMSVNMPVAPLDPVLLQQSASEVQSDPLLRSLYFGTQDSPGFYNQLQQAGANLIGSDVPLQQTAGLSPLELLARQQAISGIGGFEPFLQQNQDLVNQAIGQSRRAEALRDPYFDRAERQMQIGLGDELGGIGQARGITTGATDRFGGSLGRLGRQAIDSTENYGGSLGESEDLLRGTLGGYDPSMTQQFYNPYEDRVVQQTIDDVLKAGDKQDIASRAREISSGAFGGSRARLGAEERRESLGKGLAQALGNIRSQGFQSAQATGLGEFARQRAAERAASSGLAGLSSSRLGAQQQMGSTLRGLTGDQFGAQQQLASSLMGYGAAGSGARQNLATGLLGIGQQRGAGASALGSQLAGYGSQIGGIGQTQEQMRAGQRGELGSYGTIGRGIQETGLGRIYEQQLGQQMRPLGVLGQIGSMLPGYQASSSRIDSQYGLPTDPTAAGLGAAFSAYGAMAPRQGQG